jgi:hypothetical protein
MYRQDEVSRKRRLASERSEEEGPCPKRSRSDEANTQPTGSTDNAPVETEHSGTSPSLQQPSENPNHLSSHTYDEGFDFLPSSTNTMSMFTGDLHNLDDVHKPTELMCPPSRIQPPSQHSTEDVEDDDLLTQDTQPQSWSVSREEESSIQYAREREDLTRHTPQMLPKIDLTFSINVSQTLTKKWSPKGTFQQKPLGELLSELPVTGNFHELTGLILVLETPDGRNFQGDVELYDGKGYEGLKNWLHKKIMQCRRDHVGSSETLEFEIVITPVRRDRNNNEGGEKGGDEYGTVIY